MTISRLLFEQTNKFCEDCQHYRKWQYDNASTKERSTLAKCARISGFSRVVRGEAFPQKDLFCSVERTYDNAGLCGPDAKYFEPRK